MKIWTIGHSTRSFDVFLALLTRHGLRRLVDIRTFPGSRRYPHFGRESLQGALATHGIEYIWMPELGGRRKAHPDSHNTLWRNEAFRGYADYMEGIEFKRALEKLEGLAKEIPTAYMCSEAVWWRCHRGLVSDALKTAGWTVLHILSEDKVDEHPYTPAARLIPGGVSYQPLV